MLTLLVGGDAPMVSEAKMGNLTEVRHGSVEFCDFEVEVGGSLLFTIEELRKAM